MKSGTVFFTCRADYIRLSITSANLHVAGSFYRLYSCYTGFRLLVWSLLNQSSSQSNCLHGLLCIKLHKSSAHTGAAAAAVVVDDDASQSVITDAAVSAAAADRATW